MDRDLINLLPRIRGRCQRSMAAAFGRRNCRMINSVPLITFTFDDFPRSALYAGGAILEDAGAAATYYASFGLMGTQAPAGAIFVRDELPRLLQGGHELGCHTFSHCHAYRSSAAHFDASITENQKALHAILPNTGFATLSYPIATPRVSTKRRSGARFRACRGGGQRFNLGAIDLNLLQACFLEQCGGNLDVVQVLIDANARARGWLIFATHDVANIPSRFGCTPSFFSEVVRRSRASGARILTMSRALDAIGAP